MLTRVITLRFNELIDGFDDAPLRDFIKDKDVVSVNEHFFTRLDQPYLAVLIHYKLPPVSVTSGGTEPGQRQKRREESWREYIPEAEIPLFNALRDWRSERAKRDGLPIYVIFTNRELGAIMAAHPTTASQLAQVQGVGSGKLKLYGAEILTVLGRVDRPPIPEKPEEGAVPPEEIGNGSGSE
ncbi:MAG: HRDC domain-containing protein [Blastocatellia bacterium]